MPPGTRRIHAELPNAGSSDEEHVLLSPASPSEAAAFFRERTGAVETAPLSLHAGESHSIRIEPAEEIPRSGAGRPLVEAMPRDARSIVRVHQHGTPGPCPPCPEGHTGPTVENCRCP
jgi:hypothetical protein